MAKCSLSKRRLPFKQWVNASAFCPTIDQNNLARTLVCLLFDLFIVLRGNFVSKANSVLLALNALRCWRLPTLACWSLIKAMGSTALKPLVSFAFFTTLQKKFIDARDVARPVSIDPNGFLRLGCLNGYPLLAYLSCLTTAKGENHANSNPKAE